MTEKLKDERINDPANVTTSKEYKLGNLRLASDEELEFDFKDKDVDLDFEKLVDPKGIDEYITLQAISSDLEITSDGKIVRQDEEIR